MHENMIDVTGVDRATLIKAAYDLSTPQGLGFIHFSPGPLPDEEVNKIISYGSNLEVHMDYVMGRAVKLSVFTRGGKQYISSPWFDHTDSQLQALLKLIGRSNFT